MRNFNSLLVSALLLFFISCNNRSIPKGSVAGKNPSWTKFSMGADLSYVAQMHDNGIVYKDAGKEKEIFAIFKDHGCNTVRLKLWHTPKAFTSGWGNDQEYNDLAHVEVLIKRAKALGMAVNLDLHYSDTWADPQKQYIPDAWKNLSPGILKDSVYQYTLHVLN